MCFWTKEKGGEKMRKRVTLLVVALVMALTMSFGVGGAFAAKTQTFEKGVCTVKAGKGQGSGEIKEEHHGQCHSSGSEV